MSRSPEGPDPELLFDLPLDPNSDTGSADEVAEPDETLTHGGTGGEQVGLDFAPEASPEAPMPGPTPAPLPARFVSALLDLVVLVAVLGLATVAIRAFGISIDGRLVVPFALFLTSFSFLYTVTPLAFWGHTPGMAYAGVMARDREGGPLTIGQCVLRWVGWVATLLTLGLAALVALSGVSLLDLLSRSQVLERPG